MATGEGLQDIDVTFDYFSTTDDEDGSIYRDLLQDAVRLVRATVHETKWYPPQKIDTSIFSPRNRGFELSTPAPCARTLVTDALHTELSTGVLRQWDADPSEDQIWAPSDLEEFDHGVLYCLLNSPQPPTIATPRKTSTHSTEEMGQKRSDETPIVTSQRNNRRKLDDKALWGVLPPPHFYTSLSIPEEQSSLLKISFFAKVGTTPIPPHTRESCDSRLRDHFARLAWIVPIRGRLQWEGTTAALLYADVSAAAPDPAQSPQPYPGAPGTDGSDDITWTHHALKQFWDFVKNLREARNLGPLSLSFHVSPSSDAVNSMPQDSHVGWQKVITGASATSPPSTSVIASYATADPGMLPSPLRAVDHFKVYHDAAHTESLRSVLNSWSYCKDGRKIRLLKGAKLALLDERSRGVLLC